jgi:hypothetical protein
MPIQPAQLIDEQMDGVMLGSNQIQTDHQQQQQLQYQQQQNYQQQQFQSQPQQIQNNQSNASALSTGRYSIEHPQGYILQLTESLKTIEFLLRI